MVRGKKLAMTMGDPAGVGPEVILKAFVDRRDLDRWRVFGCRDLFQQTYDRLGGKNLLPPDRLPLVEVPLAPGETIFPGQGSAASGAIGFACLQQAIAATVGGEYAGIVTAPIAKEWWHAAGHIFPGQTEVLAQAGDRQDYGMLFVGRSPHTGYQWRVLLATTHIPLYQVPQRLNPPLLSQKLALLLRTLREDFDCDRPTIAIAGLNPHSGEGGKLGTEEETWLKPWIAQMRDRYPHCTLIGPVPPDTMWIAPTQAWLNPEAPAAADAYLALYHDQGLIPVKAIAFDEAINTTIGLPWIRTSPDHGTAFDIAGRGIARPTSMIRAMDLALAIAETRALRGENSQSPPCEREFGLS